MRKTFAYLSLIILLTACTKNNNQEHVLTGRLMQSCETPAANKDGLIYFDGGGLLNNPSTTLEFTTDENGYFEVKHNEPFTEFSIRTSAAHSVLEVSSIPDDNDLGEVYISPFPINFIINLDVKNPYTENDTLLLADYSDPDPFAYVLIPGPFESGFLDSIVNHYHTLFPIKYNDVLNEGGPRNSIGFRLRSLPDFNSKQPSQEFYSATICSGDFTEVTLVIE